jgi:hypothetical protein
MCDRFLFERDIRANAIGRLSRRKNRHPLLRIMLHHDDAAAMLQTA